MGQIFLGVGETFFMVDQICLVWVKSFNGMGQYFFDLSEIEPKASLKQVGFFMVV